MSNVTTLPKFNPSNNVIVQGIKDKTEELIRYIEANVPNNRQRAIALTNYEQAAMWAVKANFMEGENGMQLKEKAKDEA